MQEFNTTARLASLEGLLKTTIPAFLNPVPSRETLRDWFDKARIPRFKSNPAARRGGGTVFYSVSAVEKFLQNRTLPCRMAAEVVVPAIGTVRRRTGLVAAASNGEGGLADERH